VSKAKDRNHTRTEPQRGAKNRREIERMKELDKIYLEILRSGLVAIRDAADSGDLHRCKAEAEHLHNLPSLLGEQNKERHLYYVSTERTAYLEWVLSTKRRDLMEFVSMAYFPYWQEMDEILGIESA
jgi:hypothetical protein